MQHRMNGWPALIKPLLKKRNEVKVSLRGKIFKKLKIENGKTQTKIQCNIS